MHSDRLGGSAVLALVVVVLLSGFGARAHAQVIACAGVSNGQAYAACSSPIANNAPTGSTEILWCSTGAVAGGAENACQSPLWYRWDNMQSYSWVLTSYAGWQRQSSIMFTGSSGSSGSGSSGTGSAKLSWTAPTTDTTGSPIAVTSYKIQYGTVNFGQSATTTATSYTINSLAPGTWQFEVIALSSSGQSAATNPVTLVLSGQSWQTQGTETVYEAVLPASGSGLIQGNAEGTIPAGKACGTQQFTSGSASYRTIGDADATLSSPSYKGRNNVAACVLQ
jgi:hypothetical protein